MNALNREIREGTFVKSRERYQALSPLAQDLIEGLMNKDCNTRLTAQQALAHPWMQLNNPEEELLIDEAEVSDDSSSSVSEEGHATTMIRVTASTNPEEAD